jgi:hypothetical protein
MNVSASSFDLPTGRKLRKVDFSVCEAVGTGVSVPLLTFGRLERTIERIFLCVEWKVGT